MTVTLESLQLADHTKFHRDGYLVRHSIIATAAIPALHHAFEEVFHGRFETGIRPDEVNWQMATGDPSLTRQICNGWKANRQIASVVLDPQLGQAIAMLAGWKGVRIMIDNVIWKPPGTRPLGYHQDSAYLSWFTPSDLMTCWIALDNTHQEGGTLEFAQSSHHWPLADPAEEFHGPEKYQIAMRQAARENGVEPTIQYVEVPAGGGSFHHGWTWHGSGTNKTDNPRRALVLHAMRSDVKYVPENFDQGIGPIYSRYKRLGDNILDENYFPITWQQDGYRTPQIDQFLSV